MIKCVLALALVIVGLVECANYPTVGAVGCIGVYGKPGRTGKGWNNSEWPAGVQIVNNDAPPPKKKLKIADVMLRQQAEQHPDKHVAMVGEVRAPFVDINALFVKQEGQPQWPGEFGIIKEETQTWRRRWFMRSVVQGHGYRLRVQFFGDYAKGGEAQALANPPTLQCGVVYQLYTQPPVGCNFKSEINK